MKDEVKLREEFIPINFVGSGKVLNGAFKQVNLIEGAILAAPGLYVSLSVINWSSFYTKFYGVIIMAGIPFALAIAGINDEDLFSYVRNFLEFRKSRRVAKYNPRAKSETSPEFIYNNEVELPRDKIMKFIDKIMNQEDDRHSDLPSDITSPIYKTYFIEDRDVAGQYGAPELPDELKTKKELRQIEKERKAEERRNKKAEAKKMKELENLRKKQKKYNKKEGDE